MSTPRIVPLSESALLVEFGNEISVELNQRAIALAARLDVDPFPGYIESVPAYASTAVYFDHRLVETRTPLSANKSTAFNIVKTLVESKLNLSGPLDDRDSRLIEIPVSFASQDAPDLAYIADLAGLSEKQVIDIFVSKTYRVYMLGFLPGFTYMGQVDERIATPRKETPRTKVAKGSIGIAGRQTGIYPFETPGGWQIIGRTDIDIFLPDNDPPCRFSPGDQVKFIPA